MKPSDMNPRVSWIDVVGASCWLFVAVGALTLRSAPAIAALAGLSLGLFALARIAQNGWQRALQGWRRALDREDKLIDAIRTARTASENEGESGSRDL